MWHESANRCYAYLVAMVKRRRIRFSIKIPPQRFLRYYQGEIQWVQVKAFDGTRVRFPASALRRFVTEDGVEGTFEMTVDENNKLISLRRIDSIR